MTDRLAASIARPCLLTDVAPSQALLDDTGKGLRLTSLAPYHE